MEKLTIREVAAALGVPYAVDGEITSLCTDSREACPGAIFIALRGERVDGHDYIRAALEKGAICAVAERAGDYPAERVLLVKNSLTALMDIAGYYRSKHRVKVVGITGSVGKTTTKDMVAAVLGTSYNSIKTQGNQNNEIGGPKTMLTIGRDTRAAVIEMGMSAPGEIRALAMAARPCVGVITNIGVSHIELLGSRENILKAKLELADCLPDDAPLLLCGDDELLAEVRIPRLKVIYYGLEGKNNEIRGTITGEADGRLYFDIHYRGAVYSASVPGIGKHLALAALAAFGVGMQLGVAPEKAAAALAGYQPSGMRQKIVRHRDITVVEDCYNASPDSISAAIDALRDFPTRGRRILVLSDMLELGAFAEESHRKVGWQAGCAGIDRLMACGELSRFYIEGAREKGMEQALYFDSGEQLMESLVREAKPEDVIWFKASRGMHLEEGIAYLYAHY